MLLKDLMFIINPYEDVRLIVYKGSIYPYEVRKSWKDHHYMNCEVISISSNDYYLDIEVKDER